MALRAQYKGICPVCGEDIKKGDRINLAGGKASHVRCCEEGTKSGEFEENVKEPETTEPVVEAPRYSATDNPGGCSLLEISFKIRPKDPEGYDKPMWNKLTQRDCDNQYRVTTAFRDLPEGVIPVSFESVEFKSANRYLEYVEKQIPSLRGRLKLMGLGEGGYHIYKDIILNFNNGPLVMGRN